ncbi:putative alpha-galactosidase D [Lachnellula suecica]|uniref:Alpha-galactosidase n=1 Tax=Lachnellula suecica TaxID=602035 RepID=A0A8T9C6D8_9HELO|nr:putative alpha-galactosidase D [Lachnellula suecica]
MYPISTFKQKALLVCSILSSAGSATDPLHTRLDNGLALTPPLGWNSYNHYSCSPNESIIHSNAQALVDLGLQARGYHFVTVDCGWTLPNRTESGLLTWNPARFPNGFPALGQFIHSLGLGFGVYSDAGIQMCMTGEPAQGGSLFHEQQDAETFASWGADLLKYDDCFSEAATGYPDTDYSPVVSPAPRYKNMSSAILSTNRPIVFQICDWGVDFPSAWAPQLGNSWRVTNDIIPAWRTIPRILNQVVPQTSFAGPGQWLDLDMLEVGNDVFTTPEEQTHFSLWAIIKSPLVVGAALKDSLTSIKTASLDILMNQDVIGYNQDSLGVAASFRRRWTAEGYEVWAGPLSGGRTVVAVVNLNNVARQLTVDLPDVGLQHAGSLKDIWNGMTASNITTSYTAQVGAHGTILLELGNVTAAGEYMNPQISGNRAIFTQIYGLTSSLNYTAKIALPTTSDPFSLSVGTSTYTVSAGITALDIPISLNATQNNTLTVVSPVSPTSLWVSAPPVTFYPSTAFTAIGDAIHITCHTNLCIPVGSKIGDLSPTGSASLSITSTSSGAKFVDVYFANNDIALATSWEYGTNTRNLTIAVNDVVTRIEVPLSGKSSELFSPGKGWEDTGIFGVLVDGWKAGSNAVVVGNHGGAGGYQTYAADFVGMGVYL